MRTETKILVLAMYELARSVQCDDGIANSAIAEAAQRLDEQNIRINMLETALKTAMTTLKQIAETPRNAGAKRNANATVKFLQSCGSASNSPLGSEPCQKIICVKGKFESIPLFTFFKEGQVIARVYWLKRKKVFKAYPEESNIFHASKLKDVRDILIERLSPRICGVFKM